MEAITYLRLLWWQRKTSYAGPKPVARSQRLHWQSWRLTVGPSVRLLTRSTRLYRQVRVVLISLKSPCPCMSEETVNVSAGYDLSQMVPTDAEYLDVLR